MASILDNCTFTDTGIFHFKVQFFSDEFFTDLIFETTSADNPTHFFINGNAFPTGGLETALDTCYTIAYKPTKDFLESKGVLDQVIYTKVAAFLKTLEDVEIEDGRVEDEAVFDESLI